MGGRAGAVQGGEDVGEHVGVGRVGLGFGVAGKVGAEEEVLGGDAVEGGRHLVGRALEVQGFVDYEGVVGQVFLAAGEAVDHGVGGVVKELFGNGVAGYTCALDDHSSGRAGLLFVLTSPASQDCGRNLGRERVLRCFKS